MRISDWSSDVCSSDLSPIEYTASDVPGRFRPPSPPLQLPPPPGARLPAGPFQLRVGMFLLRAAETEIGGEPPGRRHGEVAAEPVGEIGRASCRGRVCQYV